MALVAKDGGGNFQIAPEGTHIARCFRMVDLGTQDETFKGVHKVMQKVLIFWELCEEKTVFFEERGEEPFSIHCEYTTSLNERSNLRKHLEAWRGKGFTDEELEGFDLTKVLGAPCMVTVSHETSASGKTNARIKAVTSIPKGLKAPPVQNHPWAYSIEDGDSEEFRTLPEWIQNKIKQSHEWRQMAGGSAADHSNQEPTYADDDIPF